MKSKNQSRFNKHKPKKPKKINCIGLGLMIINFFFMITINVVTGTQEKFKNEMLGFWVFGVFLAILAGLEIGFIIMFVRVVRAVQLQKQEQFGKKK